MRRLLVAVVLFGLSALLGACHQSDTRPGDPEPISLDQLEDPSYYIGDSLITFERSTARLVVRFSSGVTEEEGQDVLERMGFVVVGRTGSPYDLTIVETQDMAQAFLSLRRSESVEWATPVLLDSQGGAVYPGNQFIIRFRETTDREEWEALIQDVGALVLKNRPEDPRRYLLAIAWPRADSVFTISRTLHQNPLVFYAHPNPILDQTAEWIEIDVGGPFVVSAPSDMEYEPLDGIDSFVGNLVSPSIESWFDYGWYSSPLGGAETVIDGKLARLHRSSGPLDSSEFPYSVTVHFPDLGDGLTKLTLVSRCASVAAQDDAVRIIQSLRFEL